MDNNLSPSLPPLSSYPWPIRGLLFYHVFFSAINSAICLQLTYYDSYILCMYIYSSIIKWKKSSVNQLIAL
jgi:hypothetical protein